MVGPPDMVGPGKEAEAAPAQTPGSPWSNFRWSSTASPASPAPEAGSLVILPPAPAASAAAPAERRLPGETSRGKRPLPSTVGAPAGSSAGAGPSSGQAGLDASATIAAVGGPAAGNIASEARKPVKGISARRSKEELQVLLQAEPYPGPFPKQRLEWSVPVHRVRVEHTLRPVWIAGPLRPHAALRDYAGPGLFV